MIKKQVKEYFCVYCGKSYKDNNWSDEHVIPTSMGGPKKYTIISCYDCNNKISKEIEQIALQSQELRTRIGELISDGFKIKFRRKKEFILVYKTVGVSFRRPIKMYYDLRRKGQKVVKINMNYPRGMTLEEIKERKSGVMIFPAEEETEKEKIAVARLANKIILGTCVWIWKDKFSRSKYADFLRKEMWSKTFDSILELPANATHLNPDWGKEENQKNKDALENVPHATIGIFELEDHLIGLVNLLGGYESMILIGNTDSSINLDIKNEGVIIIAKSTENAVMKMTWEQYREYKSKIN